jgi:hypothetical protein
MKGVEPAGERATYDRRLLLAGALRNTALELWEVERYGTDNYGDADYVSIYGLRPADWHARGVRLLGRTAVECTRDTLAKAIAADVAAVASRLPHAPATVVVDPFAGSCNTLYWLQRSLPGVRSVGFESDAGVFQLTARNLATLALPIELRDIDYRDGLARLAVASNELLIAFVAPPWGDALDPIAGLDLRRTCPPVGEVVDLLSERFAHNPVLCAIQVYEKLDATSVAELKARFDWSDLRIYPLIAPGQNHGLIMGTQRWDPGSRIAWKQESG